MEVPQPIRERLLKIKALADSGQTAEAATANAHLDRLLAVHGLTRDDLAGEKPVDAVFTTTGRRDRDLAARIIRRVTGRHDHPLFRVHGKPKVLLTRLTPAQRLDVLEMLAYYRAAFDQEIGRLFTAFVFRHHLFTPAPDVPQGPLTPDEAEDLRKTAQMMEGLTSQAFAKPARRIAHAS